MQVKSIAECPQGEHSAMLLTFIKLPFVKPVLNGHSQKDGFQDRLSLNAGQRYCRMPRGEHSAILLTFIKLPFVKPV